MRTAYRKKSPIVNKVFVFFFFGSTEYIYRFGGNSVYGDLGISEVLGSAPWISSYLCGSALLGDRDSP